MEYSKMNKTALVREIKKMAPYFWANDPALNFLREARAVLSVTRENLPEYSRERDLIGAALSLIIESEITLENAGE